MKKNNEEYVYIVLVKALTGLGNFTRKLTRYEYTHIAVCLNENIDDFITFSRRKHFAPFDSGFMHETLDCYAFGNNRKVKLKVYKLPIRNENMTKIKEYINCISNDKEYIFNLYSMISMPLFHGFRIYKAHNCMSFVSKIIQLSNAVSMDKEYFKYNIKELDELLTNYIYDEKYYIKEKNTTDDYMNKISFFENANMFLKLNGQLIYRIIRKRGLISNEE